MTTAWWWRPSWATLAGIEDEVKVCRRGVLTIPAPKRWRSSSPRPAATLWPSPSAPAHGAYKFKPEQCTRNEKGVLVPPPLRFDMLEEVSKRLPGFPIVLHGSSSVPQEYVKMVNEYGGKMPDAIGVPEEQLRQGCQAVRLQDQHRLRPASGHDRHHPQVHGGASRQVRSPRVPEARPRQHQGAGDATSWWTCWAAPARPDPPLLPSEKSRETMVSRDFFGKKRKMPSHGRHLPLSVSKKPFRPAESVFRTL